MLKIVIPFSRRAVFLCLALAVFNLYLPTVLGAGTKTAIPHAGELTAPGGVHVDDTPAVSGQTFFSGSTFRVGAAYRSTLTLNNLSRLELSAETVLKLDFSDDQVRGLLESGRVRVFAPAGITARFETTDATILADSRQPATFTIESGRSSGTTVLVEAGRVEMSEGKRRQLVSAGQFISTAGGAETLANGRQNLSGDKKAGLVLGLAGLIAMITLIFTGRSDKQMLNFGGCVPGGIGASPATDSCR